MTIKQPAKPSKHILLLVLEHYQSLLRMKQRLLEAEELKTRQLGETLEEIDIEMEENGKVWKSTLREKWELEADLDFILQSYEALYENLIDLSTELGHPPAETILNLNPKEK